MRRIKCCTSIFLTILLLLQCLSFSAMAAEDGAGFTDVKINADKESQIITVTGKIASEAKKELTVILKQNSNEVYLNQFSSDNSGAFSVSLPVSFTYGDPFTLQLGGASSTEAYVTDFTAGEKLTVTGLNLGVSYTSQKISVSGTISSQATETLTLTTKKNGVAEPTLTFDSNKGAFAYSGKLTVNVGDVVAATISGEGVTEKTTSITVVNDAGGDSGGDSGSSGSVTPTPPVVNYTITATAGTGGTITPTSKQVKKNESATFSIQASSGYEIKNVLVDGASVGAVSTYTFNSVTGDHSISAEFLKKDVPAFSDVKSGSWYYDAVMFACEHGLFKGTSATNFSPDATMTRSMLVTVLYRLAGNPKSGVSNFGDVESGSWYADAVSWASSQGIVMGNEAGKFDPDGNVTREQIATILYRFVLKTGKDSTASGDLSKFSDGNKVSDFAAAAMKWAVGCNLISGKDGSTLDPGGDATRAEVATIMMRFFKLFAM